MFKFLVFLFLCFSAFKAWSFSDNIKASENGKQIETTIKIFEDKSSELTIADIQSPKIQQQFSSADENDFFSGFTSSAYWIKLNIINPQTPGHNWYLEIDDPLIDNIDFYSQDSMGNCNVKNSGDRLAFHTRDFDYRNFIFYLNRNVTDRQTYYLRFKSSSSMRLSLRIWTYKSLLNKISTDQIINGIFYGAIIIMIIYGLFLFIGFRDQSYIFYIFLLILLGLTRLSLDGLAFQYIWPDWEWWNNASIPFFIIATSLSITHLSRLVLFTKRNNPVWHSILFWVAILYSAELILSLTLPYDISIQIATLSLFITAITLTYLSLFIALKKRYRPAYFFLFAFGLLFTGIVFFTFNTFGWIKNNFFTDLGMHVGTVSLMLLLSVAIQDRIKQEKKSKYLKQRSALEERTTELARKNELLNDRARELASLNRLADKVNFSLNINDVLQTVCDELVKIFNVRNAGIGLLDREKTKLKIVAFRSNDPDEADATGIELPIEGNEASQIVIDTKQPVAIENAQTDPRTKAIHEIMKRRGTTGLLIVPILSRIEVIGTIGMPARDPGQIFSQSEIDLAKTIATQVASSIENAQLYTRTEKALGFAERDLEIGREIQNGFLPQKMPQIPGWEMTSYFEAARQVAGDFFDAFKLKQNEKIGMVVADVCDKGVGAALFMVVFRSLIRAFSEERQNVEDSEKFLLGIVSFVNTYIAKIHETSNMFATVFFAVLEPKTETLYYINAGHDVPAVIDQNGNLRKLLEPTGPAIGLAEELSFTVERIKLNRGDIMVAYTDGVTDARNSKGHAFSEEKLFQYLQRPYPSAFSLLKYIETRIKDHLKETNQFDDITMLALRYRQNEQDYKHGITYTAQMQNLPLLRSFVEQACEEAGLSDEITFAYKIAVEEACINIILHGYKNSEPGPITLLFEKDSDKVQLCINDQGFPFNPKTAAVVDITSDWDERKMGGLGVYMIKEMMDEIEYKKTEDGSNLLILVKQIC